MTTKTFSEFYYLPETEVYAIRNVENGVSFFLDMDFQMKFEGGNHVRTEFDMTFYHESLFRETKIPHDFECPISLTSQSYQNGVLTLTVNGETLAFPETEIIVHPNVKPYENHSIG